MPELKEGRDAKGKIILVKPYEDEGDDNLLSLTDRMRQILLNLSEYLDWKSRWGTLPVPLDNDDTRDAYVSDLKLRLMTVINFCERMIDCITDDDDVIQAINNVYNKYLPGKPMPESTRTTNLGGTITGCNKDQLWGAINQLIESMHANNLDFQEAVEVLSQPVERLADVIAAIPIFETLPVDDAFNFAQNVLTDDIYTAYVGNDTEGYRIELKCDLFCTSADNGCVLTIDMLSDYFVERVGYVGIEDFNSVMIFISSGAWVGTQVNDIFYSMQIVAMKFGNSFLDIIGIKMFEYYMAQGANNPDPDWEILCTECSNLCRLQFQYDNDPEDFTILTGTDDPDFWIASDPFEGTDYVVYSCDEDVPGDIVRIRLYFSDNLPKSCQVFTTTNTYVLNGTPAHAGGGVYYLSVEIPNDSGNFTGVLARQDIGVSVEFFLMGTTVVYEC